MYASPLHATLAKYIPPQAADTIVPWILTHRVKIKITRSRSTKTGDYRPPQHGHGHRITINHDLNPYYFLVTLIHEFAHLETWLKHKNKVLSHGKEWKEEFRQLLSHFMHSAFFPDDVLEALKKYAANPAASSCTDYDLYKALGKYDTCREAHVYLSEVPDDVHFTLGDTRIFVKKKLLRKRYHCVEVNSRREYLISAAARVVLVSA